MIITVVIAFLSLIALMIVHEFGHFIIAKKFGVKVEEFGIGYPPRIFGKQFGETLYSLNWIPLGAFVKIYGEDSDIDDYRSFSSLAIWKRILIVLGGVLAFWIAAAIIFSFALGIGSKIPTGDNDVQGFPHTQVQVILVADNSPAKLAGLQPGDGLVKIESQKYESGGASPEILPINKISDFQNFVKAHGSEQLSITFLRDGKSHSITLSPRVDYPEGQGPLGVSLERFTIIVNKYAWWQAPWQGLLFTGKVTWEALIGIVKVVSDLSTGKGAPPEAQLAGPIGITIFLARAADYGAGFFLYFIGSISVLIAIFNLFPIPALDGGKLLFLIIEKIRKKPVSVKIEQNLTVIFFVLLISMSLFVTIKFDIPRLSEFLKAGLR